MSFNSLPSEILRLIAENVGAQNLRASCQYLLISKQWYYAALPVFFSGLKVSRLSSHDLERFPSRNTPLSNYITEKSKRIAIRLVGHPSKQTSQLPWIRPQGAEAEDDTDDEADDKSGWDYWMTTGPKAANSLEGGRKSYVWYTEEHQLRPWTKRINQKLSGFAAMLPAFENLKELTLEVSSEDDPALGPRWNYLLGSTLKNFVQALPIGLRNFTLDTCGSDFALSRNERRPVHICPLIARRLTGFERVRIRMRHICPQILEAAIDQPAAPSKLVTLAIRLSLPYFPEASDENHDGFNEFDVQPCRSFLGDKNVMLDAMFEAGSKFAKTMNLQKSRITHRDRKGSAINILVADCVKNVHAHSDQVFSYEDDGRAWDPWEEDDYSTDFAIPFENYEINEISWAQSPEIIVLED